MRFPSLPNLFGRCDCFAQDAIGAPGLLFVRG